MSICLFIVTIIIVHSSFLAIFHVSMRIQWSAGLAPPSRCLAPFTPPFFYTSKPAPPPHQKARDWFVHVFLHTSTNRIGPHATWRLRMLYASSQKHLVHWGFQSSDREKKRRRVLCAERGKMKTLCLLLGLLGLALAEPTVYFVEKFESGMEKGRWYIALVSRYY